MEFTELAIPGCRLILPNPFEDSCGVFIENQTFKTMTKNRAVFSLNPIRVFNELTEAAKF